MVYTVCMEVVGAAGIRREEIKTHSLEKARRAARKAQACANVRAWISAPGKPDWFPKALTGAAAKYNPD